MAQHLDERDEPSLPHFHELAVIGGTGLYDNVRGTVTSTLLSRNPERDLLVFRLVV